MCPEFFPRFHILSEIANDFAQFYDSKNEIAARLMKRHEEPYRHMDSPPPLLFKLGKIAEHEKKKKKNLTFE